MDSGRRVRRWHGPFRHRAGFFTSVYTIQLLPGGRTPVGFPIPRKEAEDARQADILSISLFVKVILLAFVLVYLVSCDNETRAENVMLATHTLAEEVK